MFKTKFRLILPALLLAASVLNVPLSHAAPQTGTAATQTQAAACTVDVVLFSANWIQGQGAFEGKLETLIEALVNGSLVFKFGNELTQLSPGVSRLFDQTIATQTATTGSSVSIEGFVKEFDKGLLGIDDFGSTTDSLPIDCASETNLALVVDVPGRAVLESDGKMLLIFVARPH
jgi:hypothetical protein